MNSDADHNTIYGNRIGTNAAGAAASPNEIGIVVVQGSHHNTFGGAAAGQGNLISGNTEDGIEIDGGSDNNIIASST